MKFIIVSGGVLSGLGKGITAASIGLLLKSSGIKTTCVKCDMYLNIDAGTMNPVEHGEVFVTHDGLETDQDLGHYERFLNQTLRSANYLTNGQIYKEVLDKERALKYDGKCVEPYHHLPPEIEERWYLAGKVNKAKVVIVELGGTVGEYEGLMFFETARRIKLKRPDNLVFVHVGYLPMPPSIGELKSKPLQQSVSLLNSLGIQPDFIVARSEKPVDGKRREKIALASGLKKENIIANPDMECVYEVPLVLNKQKLAEKIIKKLRITAKKRNLKKWEAMVAKAKSSKTPVKIAIVGKYQKTGDYMLKDSYVCVVEALRHAALAFKRKIEMVWVDSEKLENLKEKEIAEVFSEARGILVPQGWGSRGTEGKIRAARFARENKIPYLGLCFGMQMAVAEFARNVLGLAQANSLEANAKTPYPVIHIIPEQKKYLLEHQYGGTIRLGAWPCEIKEGSLMEASYKKFGKGKTAPWHLPNPNQPKTDLGKGLLIYERHRHRYEFNLEYKEKFEEKGMVFSGMSPDGKLVEAVEISGHPFFVGTQFHPEYLSRPLSPHPIFLSFIGAAVSKKSSYYRFSPTISPSTIRL